MGRLLIGKSEELAEGRTIKFSFKQDGISYDGFAARFQGQVVAYFNRCMHIPVNLDYGDNRFFRGDGKYFICQAHGATYEPLTGKCVEGPCSGGKLKKLVIEEQDQELWVQF